MIYEPQEDSLLLSKWVSKFARGKVLDLGTGSGIQAFTAAKKKSVKKVFAIDIDPEAIALCKARSKSKKIQFLVSELFSALQHQLFDTIIFNPPYLPENHSVLETAIAGGKKGYELLTRAIAQFPNWLSENGIGLIVFSSLTGKAAVDEAIARAMLKPELLERAKFPFEEIYVYKLTKSPELKRFQRLGISDINYFAKGKRGMVWTGKWKSKTVAIKVKRPESLAIGRIKNEGKFLRLLNRHRLGPKLLLSGKNFCIYVFADGIYLKDWLARASPEQKRAVFKQIFKQCFKLDSLGIAKEEMHRPWKHVIIGRQIKLIDFERAHFTPKPHNVTQFAHFVSKFLEKNNGEKLLAAAKAYSNNRTKENFGKLLRLLK